ncbi:hypothetical protein K458DRAFT_387517 [Lentithecium fluviatile CBS 122367]|uniref:Uncharacterized protein n=1 Tax=Lentithecium fluviatile CBS 122367 TaxID=1168545 RepID=A0A6G1J570_9PLEO|nr:hypothetical protein K458DRAFT_387517 [Lentithecium fluviatile CBS 122367]
MKRAGMRGGGDNDRSRDHWDELLTERSRKFYDGTYEWDGSDGFWDENRVYHKFNDPNDPEGRPPTPRPVSPLKLEDEDADADTMHADSPKTVSRGVTTPGSLEGPKGNTNRLPSIRPLLPKSILENTEDNIIMHLNGSAYKPTIPHKDLYTNNPNRERLFGRIEGMLVGQWAERTGLSLQDCYKLCGIPITEALLAKLAMKDWDEKQPWDKTKLATSNTPFDGEKHLKEMRARNADPMDLGAMNEALIGHYDKDTSARGGAGQKDEADSSDDPFSSCPSDLSDWDVDDLVRDPNMEMEHALTDTYKLKQKPGAPAVRRPDLKRKNDDQEDEHQQNKKGKKGTARVIKGRGSSIDSGVGGISTRRRSA